MSADKTSSFRPSDLEREPLAKEAMDETNEMGIGDGKQDPTRSQYGAAYWQRAMRTGCMIMVFTSVGIIEGVKGPTILDLSTMFETTVTAISAMFIFSATTSIAGCFIFSSVLHKFPNFRLWLIFIGVTIYGLPITLVTAAAPNIYLFYLIWSICGLGGGTIETGLNVYCLDVWRGHSGGGPWMHSIHFGFSLGATIGPILAAPFLSEDSSRSGAGTTESHNHPLLAPNLTLSQNDTSKESRIGELYPISGAIVLASSLGFLIMATQGSLSKRSAENEKSDKEAVEEPKIEFEQKTTVKLVTFVALICIFFFLYVGAEVVMGVYLTTFAVKSSLHTTKAEGAYVNAVFWGTFTAGRFISIFMAIYLNPLHTMVLSFGLCIGSGVALCLFAEHSLLALQVMVAVMGLGMAAIYATGLLWSEKYIVVTNKIGSAFALFAMAGPDIFPIIVGSYIEDSPMFLIYMVLATILGCTLIFALAALVGKGILEEKAKANTRELEIHSSSPEKGEVLADNKC